MRSDTNSAAPPLRPGPNGLPRDRVRTMQCERILAAAVDAVAELGYPRMTVAQVIARARVSRKTFYDIFGDREGCFLAAFERAASEAELLAREAYDGERSWREGIRSSLNRLLVLMDEQPRLAKLVVVDSLAAGQPVLRRRAELLGELAAVIDRGRSLTDAASEPARLTGEGVAGCIAGVLYLRLLEPQDQPLTGLLGPLMSMIVLPYLGAAAARQEMHTRTSERGGRRRRQGRVADKGPLAEIRMRLTYRTLRALTAIAEQPGASNRNVATASGITDQGQISRLLLRLKGLDLIENIGGERGSPNAWRLTAVGAQLERAMRQRNHTMPR